MPVGDISVLLMADYGVELYGNAIIVNSKFAADGRGERLSQCVHARPQGDRKESGDGR